MFNTPTRVRAVRRLLSSAAAVIVFAAGCSGDADPADYVADFNASQVDLNEAIDGLFDSTLAREVETVVGATEEADEVSLDPEEDALVRRWVIEFWTGAFDAMRTHRDDLEDVGVPDSMQAEHDAYVTAIDKLLATADAVVASAESSSGTELLAGFWDGTPEIDAVNTACRRLVAKATVKGHDIVSPICEQ